MTASPVSLDRLCIHQVTLMPCDFRESIECLARNGVPQTAIWRDKLDQVGIAQAKRILSDSGVKAVSLCPGGLLTAPDKSDFEKAVDDNIRWIDQAAEIGAASIVTITGGLADGSTDLVSARERAIEGLNRIAPVARAAGITLALEPLHPMVCGFRSVISTLDEAMWMLSGVDVRESMGIALDTYGLWWDAKLTEQIDRAGSRICNFHVADWLGQTRDIRLDRGMPGDGLIDNRRIRKCLDATGFSGPLEVEIFSEYDWWKRDPDMVVRTVIDRLGADF